MILYAPSRASSTWKLVLVNKELRMANPHDTPVPENTVVFMHMPYDRAGVLKGWHAGRGRPPPAPAPEQTPICLGKEGFDSQLSSPSSVTEVCSAGVGRGAYDQAPQANRKAMQAMAWWQQKANHKSEVGHEHFAHTWKYCPNVAFDSAPDGAEIACWKLSDYENLQTSERAAVNMETQQHDLPFALAFEKLHGRSASYSSSTLMCPAQNHPSVGL
ncbi:MAG: hypothetical protein FRX49_02483 [Trebouxia sp. A1-2]|nr:MAG: hypothetical protein FRX49_02483 [Trebouxia sp. A1-2]